MKSLHKFRHGLDTVLSWVCALLFAAMVVVGTYQIVTRYFFGRPSTVSEELLTYSFTWMALLSSALVFGKRDHMRMGFLADKITGTPRKVLEIISECLVLLLAGCRCYAVRWCQHHEADHDPGHSLSGHPHGHGVHRSAAVRCFDRGVFGTEHH